MYLGSLPAHLSNVPLVLTLKTGYITPQYHVVSHDCFSTVESDGSGDERVELWKDLFRYSNSMFDYFSEEDDLFEAFRFEREKTDEERTQWSMFEIEEERIRVEAVTFALVQDCGEKFAG